MVPFPKALLYSPADSILIIGLSPRYSERDFSDVCDVYATKTFHCPVDIFYRVLSLPVYLYNSYFEKNVRVAKQTNKHNKYYFENSSYFNF
jgi:hypothetical protein